MPFRREEAAARPEPVGIHDYAKSAPVVEPS